MAAWTVYLPAMRAVRSSEEHITPCKQTVRAVSKQALGQDSHKFAFRSTSCVCIAVCLLCCPRVSCQQDTGSAALSHSSYLPQLHGNKSLSIKSVTTVTAQHPWPWQLTCWPILNWAHHPNAAGFACFLLSHSSAPLV